MSKILYKKNKFIFAVVMFMFFVLGNYTFAASFNVTTSTSTLEIGGTANIVINGSDLAGRFNISSSNAGVASVGTTSVFLDNNSATVVVTAKAAGTAVITIAPASGNVSDSSGNDISGTIGTKTISITVKEKATNNNTGNNNNNSGGTSNTTNGNANLKKLVPNYEGLSPNFNPDVTRYSLTVPSTATKLGLTVQVAQQGAKYWIEGDENLKNGDNTVTITVTATNGTKKVYTIIVTRAADVEKANAYLNNIIVDGKELSPAFNSETFDYTISDVSAGVQDLNVFAYAKSEKAKIEITGNKGLVEGENIIKIKVTAEDGVTTKNYNIKVNKEKTTTVVEDDDLVVPIDVEVYPYDDINNTNGGGFNAFKSIIKENLLDLLLLALVLVEFAQIVYFYMKDRKEKENKPDDINIDKKVNIKDNNEDKYSDTRRRARASVDESLNNIGVATPNNNDEIQKVEEEKIEPNSFVQEKDEFDNSDELNDEQEEINDSESKDDNQDE